MTHSQHDSTIPDTSLNGEHINQFTQSMPINMMAAAAQAHLPHLYNHNPATHQAHFSSDNNNNNNNSNHSSPRLAHPPIATPGAAAPSAPAASTSTTSTSHSLNASPLSTPPPPPTSTASLVGLHHHLSHIPAPAQPVPVATAPSEEEPLYVNAKQYHRILKRRTARLRLEELNRIARSRKPYLHESRHKHAMRRPRGPGGRFLTSSEIAALEKQKDHDPSHHGQDQSKVQSE
ncbi:CCAAT-binding transcription factor (CBF-B/NF-YA) subunit B-domain-containing protein [Absidia repens]|uniref:Transcriptional activator HAP2 n=1 Tax=Absidia repens TaxID=90262 RepID=A0A1X2IC76_9FUNG|nr:CCAAT-binding transcription factor (CBF-B/NF-YA) subunit B-domain-containing protein [Absidia repens]